MSGKKQHAVAITGARGLLGATLMHGLEKPAAIAADVRDADALRLELVALKPAYVIHTAAITNVGACEREPDIAYAVNAEGTRNVVEAARAIGAPILYVSTASVFKGDKGNYSETDIPEPNNVYDRSKVRGEEYTHAYERGSVVRLNLMGIHPDGSRGRNFMEWLVDSFSSDKDVTLFDDVRINALSNWTISELFRKMIEREIEAGIYHIGTHDVLSKAEIGESVARYFPNYSGKIIRASVDSIADGVPRAKEMWLNCDYTARVLGITMPSMHDEIERIMRAYHS